MAKIESKMLVVEEVKAHFKNAKSIVVVSSRGLSVSQDTTLRKKLRDAGVVYKVYKNTIMEFAVKDTEFEGATEFFTGPTAVAFSYDDATAAARIISKEIKTVPKLEFKGAVVENVVYDAKGIQAIADIPSKEELLSKLLGSFKSPMSAFARVINAIAEKKEEGSQASDVTEA